MVQRVRNDVLLGDHCDPRFHAKRISVPLLIGHCRDAGRAPEEVALRSRFLNYLPSQILTSGLIDCDESTIAGCCPGLPRSELRRFSYANVFYTDVRSALVHEYRFGSRVDPMTMSEDAAPDEISYGNWMGAADRHVHFPIEWVCGVAESVARTVDAAVAVAKIVVPPFGGLRSPEVSGGRPWNRSLAAERLEGTALPPGPKSTRRSATVPVTDSRRGSTTLFGEPVSARAIENVLYGRAFPVK